MPPAGLNLSIPARQKVAICGRSGSGKSTLVMGLSRMARKIQVSRLTGWHVSVSGGIVLSGTNLHRWNRNNGEAAGSVEEVPQPDPPGHRAAQWESPLLSGPDWAFL